MGQIYTYNGQQVYDYNGQTYSATTGAIINKGSTSAPAPTPAPAPQPAKSQGTTTISNSQVAGLPNLAPGMSGAEVKILQQWLIQNGYSIPDGATGYYGDQTKAAVAAWQQRSGFNTQGNPGFFGPISKSYLSGQPVPPANSSSPVPTPAPATPASPPAPAAPATPAAPAAPATPPPVSPQVAAPVPETVAFKSTAAYKALSPELKQFVDMSYNLVTVGGESDASAFAGAIEQAKAIAGPYLQSQLELAKGEIISSVAKANGDYQTAYDTIQRTRDALLKSVSLNKDALTLEEQATLAREARNYGYDLQDIIDTGAEKGLNFATGLKSSAEATTRRTAQYQDVIQSDQRNTNLQIAELEAKAAAGDRQAQDQLASINREKSTTLQDIGRNAERVLGSDLASTLAIPGYTPSANVKTGTVQEGVNTKTIADIAGLVSLQKGFSGTTT